jgi:hypothetical protein
MLYHVRGIDGFEGGVRKAGQVPRIAYMVYRRAGVDIEYLPSLRSDNSPYM